MSTHLANYSYLGLRSFVEVDYTEPDIRYTLVGVAGGNDPDNGDIYRGLDRFGRVKDCRWNNCNSATDVDRIKYGYDRNGNRQWRENVVASEQYGKNFDELYGHDQIDRLQTMDRGDLTSLKDSIQNKTFAQDWALDPVGNWKNFREDDNGDSTWDLNQQRTANKVNEISNISESVGPAWVTPAYDRAGNMTTIPKPADPTIAFTATYDPWNRLVKIEEPDGMGGTQKLAEYAYDRAKRRTVKKTYSGGSLDETRYFFYTEPSQWQIVEERVDSSTDPDRQFVWGLRYIDDLVLRDRDTNTDGALDERLYALQDANWNVTCLATDSATIAERYAYSAYGTVDTLTGAFADRTATLYQWETQLSGYRFDRESRLYCVRNRMYSAALGTWTQRDPIKYADAVNLYEYAHSLPLVFTDPNGLAVIAIALPVIGALTAAEICLIVFGVALAVCLLIKACYQALQQLLASLVKGVQAAIQQLISAIKKSCRHRAYACHCADPIKYRPPGSTTDDNCFLLEMTSVPPCICIYRCVESGVTTLPGTVILI